eukprot:jgi/Astpho2/632/Aster-04474
MVRAWFFTRHGNVWIYVPNLIGVIVMVCVIGAMLTMVPLPAGYARVLTMLFGFSIAQRHPVAFVIAYFLAFVADETDGRYARKFQQTSTLGGVLDMVTDRVSTTGLLLLLTAAYPHLQLYFMLLVTLDLASHWYQMYATLAAGGITHKDIDSHSMLVRYYYQHRIFMGFCCVSVEVLYLLIFLAGNNRFREAHRIHLPLPKQAAVQICQHVPGQPRVRRFHWFRQHFCPGCDEYRTLSAGCEQEQFPMLLVLACLCLPGALIKQFINIVQLRNAMSDLIVLDRHRDQAKRG